MAVSAVIVGGCTSLKPVGSSVVEVREQLRSGEISTRGEQIRVVTEDGTSHDFEVVEVTDRAIRGDVINVPIDEIVSLNVKQFDFVKTTFVVLGIGLAVYVAAVMHVMNSIIDDLLEY